MSFMNVLRRGKILPFILAALLLAPAAPAAADAEVQSARVQFSSHDRALAGNLYLPADYQAGQKLPAVVITGAWTTVKEQMPATYAKALAARGYAAMVFDFRGWGESEGDVKYLEDPARKTADIHAAADYLATRPEVDSGKIAGLGICASAGYMSDAAATNPNIGSLALVAPWLHDSAIVEAVYGGAEGVRGLLAAAKAADAVYLDAASATNEQSLMYQVPYYTEEDRGLIPEYDNKFNVASWAGWLGYDALKTAGIMEKPVLLVHSEAAAIPQGAREYARRAGDNVRLIMLEDVTQFDFYDQPQPVAAASDAAAEFFAQTLN